MPRLSVLLALLLGLSVAFVVPQATSAQSDAPVTGAGYEDPLPDDDDDDDDDDDGGFVSQGPRTPPPAAPPPVTTPPPPSAAPVPIPPVAGAALLDPFPVVRVTGEVAGRWTRIRSFRVTRLRAGHAIELRCLGSRCPYPVRRTVARGRIVFFSALERRLTAGTVIEVRITARARAGKLSRLRFRTGRPPARVDTCVAPGTRRATSCKQFL